jgi:hypothetical protein
MDRDEIIKGILICAIFTNEDERLFIHFDETDCDETAYEIAGAAADAVMKFVADNDLTLPEYSTSGITGANYFTFGTDIWFTASRSGVSFKNRGDSDDLEKLTEFCRTRLAQIEHAKTWFDEETGKFRISIYQRNF